MSSPEKIPNHKIAKYVINTQVNLNLKIESNPLDSYFIQFIILIIQNALPSPLKQDSVNAVESGLELNFD